MSFSTLPVLLSAALLAGGTGAVITKAKADKPAREHVDSSDKTALKEMREQFKAERKAEHDLMKRLRKDLAAQKASDSPDAAIIKSIEQRIDELMVREENRRKKERALWKIHRDEWQKNRELARADRAAWKAERDAWHAERDAERAERDASTDAEREESDRKASREDGGRRRKDAGEDRDAEGRGRKVAGEDRDAQTRDKKGAREDRDGSSRGKKVAREDGEHRESASKRNTAKRDAHGRGVKDRSAGIGELASSS